MSKRPRPWDDDYERQSKVHVNDHLVNENNEEYMNQIYQRTNELLFVGARRAAMTPSSPTYSPRPGNEEVMPVSPDYSPRGSSYSPDDATITPTSWDDSAGGPLPAYYNKTYYCNNMTDSVIPTSPNYSPKDASYNSRDAAMSMVTSPDYSPGYNASGVTQGMLPTDSKYASPWPFVQSAPNDTKEETQTMQWETGTDDLHNRRRRFDRLKSMERRDPSPMPTLQNQLQSFLYSARRVHGQLIDEEKVKSAQETKNFRQLTIDSFLKKPESTGGRVDDDEEEKRDMKDVNDNKAMEF